MMKSFRIQMAVAATLAVAASICYAQAGADAYKLKCAMCHGATGTPAAFAANMGAKPAGSPEMKKLTNDQILAVIKSGKGKMKAVAGITDAQAKDAAAYYKSLK